MTLGVDVDERVDVPDLVAVTEGVGVCVEEAPVDCVCDVVDVDVGDLVTLAVGVREGEVDRVCVLDGVRVPVMLLVGVLDGELLVVLVLLAVGVPLLLGVDVPEIVAVLVLVLVCVLVTLRLDVSV